MSNKLIDLQKRLNAKIIVTEDFNKLGMEQTIFVENLRIEF